MKLSTHGANEEVNFKIRKMGQVVDGGGDIGRAGSLVPNIGNSRKKLIFGEFITFAYESEHISS